MDDQRPVSAAGKAFFSLGTGSGIFVISFLWKLKFLMFSIFQVPVMLIFTKFDALEDMCYNKLRSQGKNHQEAKDAMHELANNIFLDEYLSRVLATDFPPKAHICLAGNILFSNKF
jgi:hypothetical protein